MNRGCDRFRARSPRTRELAPVVNGGASCVVLHDADDSNPPKPKQHGRPTGGWGGFIDEVTDTFGSRKLDPTRIPYPAHLAALSLGEVQSKGLWIARSG